MFLPDLLVWCCSHIFRSYPCTCRVLWVPDMDHFSKKRNLLIVQMDSITGETAGSCIGLLYEAGALNVQVVNTVTKKNRPGFMFVIDCADSVLDSVERVIVGELGATGWQRVASEHCYIEVETQEKEVLVTAGGKSFTATLQRKVSSANPGLIRPEYDCCIALRDMLAKRCGVDVPLSVVSQKIVEAFLNAGEAKIKF